MSVQDYCRLYLQHRPRWDKCRVAIKGEYAIKDAMQLYLPRASGMDDDDYKGYLTRAQFFNAAGRTLDGLNGLINRKPAMYKVPKGMEKYLENVDGRGHSLQQFVQLSVKERLITNWGGILLDMPKVENVKSQKEFEEQNLSAYMTLYSAESIINWSYQNNGRRKTLKYIIFREEAEIPIADYTVELRYNYRVCEIGEDGYYQQTLYNDRNEIIDVVKPRGKYGLYKDIPFYFLPQKVTDLITRNIRVTRHIGNIYFAM